jgi:HSP20 family protein
VIKAELPGLDKKDIKLTLSDGLLTIAGERKQEKETKGKNYHRVESSYGSFQRTINLPVPVQADKIKADYKRGVLEITLPKAEEAKTREIQIDVG